MTTGLEAFDTTLQETNLWLKELMARLDTDDRRLAYKVLKATLHALRDRIGPQNAAHLGAQLPMLIRGFYYEGWHAGGTPTKERHKRAFLDHVHAEIRSGSAIDAERAVKSVFEVMWDKIDPGEIAKLINLFPEELRDLWPRLARGD